MLGGTGDTSSDNISVNSRYSENLRICQTSNIENENRATDFIRK